MLDVVSLLHVPLPAPDGCTGACFGHPEADSWRASEPDRYVDWVVRLDERDARAPVTSVWELEDGIVWATGLAFDQTCALVRRALRALGAPSCSPDEAVAAREDVRRASRLADESTNEVYCCASPLCELGALTSFANAIVHTKLIQFVDSKFHAGLWRSLSRSLERDPLEEETPVRAAISALRAHAQCEALRLSAAAAFDAGKAAAALACARKALDVGRCSQKEPCLKLEKEFAMYEALCARLGCGSRVFDTSLMQPCVPLPDV